MIEDRARQLIREEQAALEHIESIRNDIRELSSKSLVAWVYEYASQPFLVSECELRVDVTPRNFIAALVDLGRLNPLKVQSHDCTFSYRITITFATPIDWLDEIEEQRGENESD